MEANHESGRHAGTRHDELVRAAVAACGLDPRRFTTVLEALSEDPCPALGAATALLATSVTAPWQRGWTPADLVHVVSRYLTAGHAEVARQQLVADGHRRIERGEALHPRWEQQLASLQEPVRTDGSQLPMVALRLVIEVVSLLSKLPPVPPTVPPPGTRWDERSCRGGQLDPRLLVRVRALLAKAESSTFEQEAAAFTAKAQELIARHAIDEALLHTADDVGEPSVRRLLIDDPYAEAKASLLSEVAAANRCRAVSSSGFGWLTVFGYDDDLDAVEVLGASLLAQATSAMVRHGSRRDAAGRSRTRSFRRAFLVGFAHRIGQRLRQATDDQVAAICAGGAGQLVPVLTARDDQVRAAERAAFPDLVHRTTSASNADGYLAGLTAAELASLQVPRHRLPDG